MRHELHDKFFQKLNSYNWLVSVILILTHPAASIYTTEEAPLSRGGATRQPGCVTMFHVKHLLTLIPLLLPRHPRKMIAPSTFALSTNSRQLIKPI